MKNVFAGDRTQLFCVTSLVAVSGVLAPRCNGDPHATKRFRNETNAIYCSFSTQPAVNWSTIGHLWLFCATGGGAPSHCQASRIQKYKINDTAAKCKTKKTKEEKILSRLLLADLFTFELSACQSLSNIFTHC